MRRLLAAGLLVAAACAETGSTSPTLAITPEDYPDVLEYVGTPSSAADLDAPAFSDLGAWHMHGLADQGRSGKAGFTGPLLLTDDGHWIGTGLLNLELRTGEAPLNWTADSGTAFPGRLRQGVRSDGIDVVLDVVFATGRTSLVRAAITNNGQEPLEGAFGWSGAVDLLPATLDVRVDGLLARLDDSPTVVEVAWGRAADSTAVLGSAYQVWETPSMVAPGETVFRFATVSAYVDNEERESFAARRAGILEDPVAVFDANRERWSSYLEGALAGLDPAPPTDPQRRLAVKAVQTLVSNWRSPAGHLFHDGLFPSYAYRGFHGVWSWDSWKHARALALFAPDLAKNQIRVMLDHQNERGMVPDVIYRDSTENNWRDTKPPLLGWAVHGIFTETHDTAFVMEVRDALERYHAWWYVDRDHDGDGLAEYGSTDGTRIAAAWESGMDNAVRFDSASMVENGPGAWSFDQESVDLNAYLYAEKLFLADLADVVGQPQEAQTHRDAAEMLAALVRSRMFDPETGFFHDVRLDDDSPVRVYGPEGWIPLWTGLASVEQASAVAQVMADSARFMGVVPFPTLDMTRPEFDPTDGYWRGPVWLDQAYFGVAGLRRYGFDTQAEQARNGLLQGPMGLLEQAPIYENYDPRNGEGLNAAHFSWSAAHYLMLLKRYDY